MLRLEMCIRDRTKVLLDTVYEPIYAHFGEEFGKTLCGFFSDEPRLGKMCIRDSLLCGDGGAGKGQHLHPHF